jgi:uncharacterized membrane protein/thiol-disulfide isomerase/thioredoxin
LTGLSALASGLCVYLSWHYLAGASLIGCGPTAPGCEELLSGRWSTVGVLPVSGLGAGVYLSILVASLFIGPVTPAPVRRLAWCAMLVLAGAIAGSAVWFMIVQKWIVGTFCPFCMATHIIGLLLAAFVIWRARMHVDDGSAEVAPTNLDVASPAARRGTVWPLPAIGLALAGILAACQAAITPPSVYRSGQSQDNLPAVDPRAVPLVGSPDAPYVVKVLFDYKCPHCQRMHFLLDEAIRRCGGRLAFALSPAPMSRQCNPYVARDADEFKDSCELAKVGLAVWLANRQAFADFNRWMFSLESGDRWQPRSVAAATDKAVELVGQTKFDAAHADPWIDEYLQTCTRIYGDTIDSDRGGAALPKLVFGSRWVTPEAHDADDLVSILRDSLAVPQP